MRRQIDAQETWNAYVLVAFVAACQHAATQATHTLRSRRPTGVICAPGNDDPPLVVGAAAGGGGERGEG